MILFLMGFSGQLRRFVELFEIPPRLWADCVDTYVRKLNKRSVVADPYILNEFDYVWCLGFIVTQMI